MHTNKSSWLLSCMILMMILSFTDTDGSVKGSFLLCTDRPPELELKNAKGLSNETLQKLQGELNELAASRCGEVSP